MSSFSISGVGSTGVSATVLVTLLLLLLTSAQLMTVGRAKVTIAVGSTTQLISRESIGLNSSGVVPQNYNNESSKVVGNKFVLQKQLTCF